MSIRILSVSLLTVFCLPVLAQKPKQELKRNLQLSGSELVAYLGPREKLSPAPDGMQPFYLSHYGRSGSCYLPDTADCAFVSATLGRAREQDKLSMLGEEVLERIEMLSDEVGGKYGELTIVGGEQQRDIARRMMESFPQVFSDDAVVSARSTPCPPCMLSMQYALLQMVSQNPMLRPDMAASRTDIPYLVPQRHRPDDSLATAAARRAYALFCEQNQCWQRVAGQLFSDVTYPYTEADGPRLAESLFRLASSLQNTELRKRMTFYDLFTDDEVLCFWRRQNAQWFLDFGQTSLNGGEAPLAASELLLHIISDADSCLKHPHPGASLRFGNAASLLPLVCLMGLNGYDKSIDDLGQLERKGWVDYRVLPMSANIQIVFYRKEEGEGDVLLKVLLNEDEATLPFEPAQGPYYRWEDFRSYYLTKLRTT